MSVASTINNLANTPVLVLARSRSAWYFNPAPNRKSGTRGPLRQRLLQPVAAGSGMIAPSDLLDTRDLDNRTEGFEGGENQKARRACY